MTQRQHRDTDIAAGWGVLRHGEPLTSPGEPSTDTLKDWHGVLGQAEEKHHRRIPMVRLGPVLRIVLLARRHGTDNAACQSAVPDLAPSLAAQLLQASNTALAPGDSAPVQAVPHTQRTATAAGLPAPAAQADTAEYAAMTAQSRNHEPRDPDPT